MVMWGGDCSAPQREKPAHLEPAPPSDGAQGETTPPTVMHRVTPPDTDNFRYITAVGKSRFPKETDGTRATVTLTADAKYGPLHEA